MMAGLSLSAVIQAVFFTYLTLPSNSNEPCFVLSKQQGQSQHYERRQQLPVPEHQNVLKNSNKDTQKTHTIMV